MSKHGRKKARRRKKHRSPVLTALCLNCGTAHEATPEALLKGLAAALNACHDAGEDVRVWHGGILKSAHGYVVPIKGEWAARTMTFTEFIPSPQDLVDESDDFP